MLARVVPNREEYITYVQGVFNNTDDRGIRDTISKIKNLTEEFFRVAKKENDPECPNARHNEMARLLDEINKARYCISNIERTFCQQRVGEDFDANSMDVYEKGKYCLLGISTDLQHVRDCLSNFFYQVGKTRNLDSYESEVNGCFNRIHPLINYNYGSMTVENEEEREEDRGRNRNENRISLNGALRSIRSGLSMLGGFLLKVVKSSMMFFSSFALRDNLSKRGEEETRLFVLQQEPTTSKQKSDPCVNVDHTKDEKSAGASLSQQKAEAEEDKPSISYLSMSGSL